MKRMVAMALALLLISISIWGCGQNTEQKEKKDSIKIGISVYNYDTFVSEMMEEVEQYALEMETKYGITVTLDILNAGGKQVTQNDQMDYFIDRECDIVCINLVDRTDASTIISRGKTADIPVIFFNRELVEEDLERWDKLYYVGAEAFESGMMQGQILVDKLKSDFSSVDLNGDGVLQYVMLEGEAGHQDSLIRTMYSLNTVKGAGYQVEKLADEIANWNRDQAKTKMAQWLQEFGNQIEVVFSNNDDMALGALDALKEAGYYTNSKLTPPVILGVDGTVEGIEAVENEEFLGTVVNDAKGQAKGMLELAYSLVFETQLSSEYTLRDGKYIRLPYQEYIK